MKQVLVYTFKVLIIAFTISSCATIFGKSHYPVTLNSTPKGATVLITDKRGDTIFNGKTPTTVNLKASRGYFQKADYEIIFSADGFKEKKFPVKATLNGFYFGNILIGGLIGMVIIDPLTGRMWALPASSQNIYATLSPLSALNNSSLNIINLADVPINQREDLVLIK